MQEFQSYVYPYGSKIILVEPHKDPLKAESNRCYLYDDRSTDDIDDDLKKNSQDIGEDIIKLLKCESEEKKLRIKRTLKKLTIFPGTKWCGAGNKSESIENLGNSNETDNCCRQHDQCFDIILAKKTKYGLKNEDSITMSHCDCDDEFYKCLRNVNSVTSHSVGKLFFNVLKVKCFRKDYPVIGCKKEIGTVKRCKEYEFDKEKAKKWQIFEPKKYRIPIHTPLRFLLNL